MFGRTSLLVAVALLFGWLAVVTYAYADTRVALVIGNSAYQHTRALPNPKNDAEAIAKMLSEIGFAEVMLKTDLDYRGLREAVRTFGEATREADIALVYYAGHGLELAGENYLVPTDARLARDVDLEYEAVTLGSLLNVVGGAKRLKLVILDACRNNPLGERMSLAAGATRSVSRGLSRIEPKGDVLVAYAARAGTVAEDGPDRHSPYAGALMKHMATPGLDIRLMFGKVRDDVLAATRQAQEPFIYGSLSGDLVSLVPAPTERPGGKGRTIWLKVRESRDIDDLKSFLQLFPGSPYEESARRRLKALRGRAPDEKPKSIQEVRDALYATLKYQLEQAKLGSATDKCGGKAGDNSPYFQNLKAPKRFSACISWKRSSIDRISYEAWTFRCDANSAAAVDSCREKKGLRDCECEIVDIDGKNALSEASVREYFSDYLSPEAPKSVGLPQTQETKGSLDGTWTGAWGGISQTSVTIVGNKVVQYVYKGNPQPVTKSSISGTTITFGGDTYTISMTRIAPNQASAQYRNVGGDKAAATLTKR